MANLPQAQVQPVKKKKKPPKDCFKTRQLLRGNNHCYLVCKVKFRGLLVGMWIFSVKDRKANQGNPVHSKRRLTHLDKPSFSTLSHKQLFAVLSQRTTCLTVFQLFHTQTTVPHHKLTEMKREIPQKLWITYRSERRARLDWKIRNKLPKQNYEASRLQTGRFLSTTARRFKAGHSFSHPLSNDSWVLHSQVSKAVLGSLLDLQLSSGSQAFHNYY